MAAFILGCILWRPYLWVMIMANAYHLMRQAQAAAAASGNEQLIDLRSDTVTRPSAEMKEWMMQAPIGDDVYGEDSSINLLEKTAAQMLGKEEGLFVSSGTQSNLIALLSHCGRGEEYLVGDKYHIYIDEAGGPSVLGSLVSCALATDVNGSLTADQITQSVKEDDPHYAITKLLCLENTVWGRIQSIALLTELTDAAKASGLSCHLDGARVMNAAVGLNVDPKEITCGFDSVSMCLSKGLGAPVGSVLCGSEVFYSARAQSQKATGGWNASSRGVSGLRAVCARAQYYSFGRRPRQGGTIGFGVGGDRFATG